MWLAKILRSPESMCVQAAIGCTSHGQVRQPPVGLCLKKRPKVRILLITYFIFLSEFIKLCIATKDLQIANICKDINLSQRKGEYFFKNL